MSSSTGSTIPRANITGYKQRQIPQFTPQQMNLFQMLLGGAEGGLGGGLDWLSKLASGDESAFSKMEAPAHRQLQGQLGKIGSRFADMGALGSSGFQQTASGAATDLSERLQSQRVGMQQGAIDRLMNLSQNLLSQRPYEQVFQKKGKGFKDLFGGLLFGGGEGGGGESGELLMKLLPLLLGAL